MKYYSLFLFLFFSSATNATLSLDALIKHPNHKEVKISPDGVHLAVRTLHDGEHVLAFMSLQPLKIIYVLAFRSKEEVGDFYWVNNQRVVTEIISRKAALERPVNYGMLYAIDFDGKRKKSIFGWGVDERTNSLRLKKIESTRAHAKIIDLLDDDDKHILISTYPWANDWETRGMVYKLNIYSGIMKKVSKLPQVGGRGFTDGKGNLLFANGFDNKDEYQLYRKLKFGWKLIEDPIVSDSYPIGFNPKTNKSYLIADIENKTEKLLELNLNNNSSTDLYQNDYVDISNLIYEPNTLVPIGVYTDADYPKADIFDPESAFGKFFLKLEKAFQGYRVNFTSFTKDNKKAVIKVSGDQLPSDFFMVDMKTKKVDFLMSAAEWLEPSELFKMEAASVKTKDGFKLGLYLTYPKNKKTNLPMVVMPHGGPHSRDFWGYDREAQILANAGYLVLQVNFRGSRGYGDHFYEAGRREWGKKIQDDIADAVYWSIEEKLADKNRICIYGVSFGGYSALMNPIRYPDLYQCAIGFAGVYDLEMMYEKGDIQTRDRGLAYLVKEIGENEEEMQKQSPMYNIDKINTPVFIVHGRQDKRVPVDHAKQLIRKLKKAGKEYESLIVPDGGHGFYTEKNNRKLYTKILSFLDKYIGKYSTNKKSS